MTNVKISLYAIVGDSFCVAAEDGDKVFERIKIVLEKNRKVTLSFQNIELLTSAFLNCAVGRLYGTFDESLIKQSLSLEHISNENKLLLKRVVDTAKIYYKDPERLNRSIDEILGE